MGNCDGNTWFSNVGGEFDGTLDLERRQHNHSGGSERFRMFCGGGLILIAKRNHVYGGRLIEDGFYRGYKLSNGRGKKEPLDEPTDGTWTAQQGPGEGDLDTGKKPKRKTAKKDYPPGERVKRARKAGGRGTKKAAKTGRKK